MKDAIDLTALVLQSAPVGEYDRRVVLLTRERGKIACFARGARRPGNPLMAATLPFCFGTYRIRQGANSNALVEVKLHTFFKDLREDMEAACYASYFSEILRYVTRENNDEAALLLLAYQSFRALESPRIPNRLVRAVFEIRTIVIEGEFRVPEETDPFSAAAGQAVRHILEAPVRTLYTFAVSEEVLGELERIAAVSIQRSLGCRFQSLEVLQALLA
ncbi:MAG: DNA repair protein RecO [Eubacteriales bacterium]|nr:DNA repair protein RecO [Eubacteriales bacterium]